MTAGEVLLSGPFILALIIHGFLVPVLLLCTLWALETLNNSARGHSWAIELNHWSTQHVWLPLARIAAIIIFIIMAYPIVFGLKSAPPIGELISSGRVNVLINTLFLISVFLPLIPGVGKMHSLVLPVQSLAAAQLVFSWLNQHSYQSDISLLPSLSAFGKIVIFVIAAHWLSYWLAQRIGELLDESFNVEGFPDLLFQSILLFLQAPFLLIYTVELGRQLNADKLI